MNGFLQTIQSQFKRNSRSIFALVITFSLAFFLSDSQRSSAADISVSAAPQYYIDTEGTLIASIDYTFSSTTSSVLSFYTANLPFVKLEEVSLTRGLENLEASVFEKPYSTDVVLVLKEIPIQSDSTKTVTLNFKVKEFYNIEESLMIFPIVFAKTPISKLQITVDKDIGPATLASYQNGVSLQKDSLGNYKFIYSKPTAQSIYILLGESAGYEFNISQTLKNESEKLQYFEIPLPRSGEGKDLLITSINTQTTGRIDELGNQFLGLEILPGQSQELTVSGEIIPNLDESNISDSSSSLLMINTYWELKPEVINAALNPVGLKTKIDPTKILSSDSEFNRRLTVTKDFVVNRLSVAEHTVAENNSGQNISINIANRLGAQKAYETKAVDAVNYADLTIALLRAQGIPARLAVGYVKPVAPNLKEGFFQNWVEVQTNDNKWIALDPAYEEITKQSGIGELNDHVVFVVRDENPIRPTLGLLESSAVNINFAGINSSKVISTEIEVKKVSRKIYEKQILIDVSLKNSGNATLTSSFISLNGVNYKLQKPSQVILGGQTLSTTIIAEVPNEKILSKDFKMDFVVKSYSQENPYIKNGKLYVETTKPWWWEYLFYSIAVTIPLLVLFIGIKIFNLYRKHTDIKI